MLFRSLSAKFPNEVCGGVQLIITDRLIVDPLATGIQLMCSLQALHPTDWQTKNLNRLLSSVPVRDAVLAGRDRHEIQRLWQAELAKFMERRQQFLLYE